MNLNPNYRRHDIDWLRVISIGLLIAYHVAIGFQSWGLMIGFITNKESWAGLWTPMSLINVWRIPILFFVSGMGVFFALQKRNWVELIKERSRRILLPFVFGALFVVPVHILILQSYYSWQLSFSPGVSHLWFLGNIFSYTLLFLPLFVWIKKYPNGRLVSGLKRLFSMPFGFCIVLISFAMEALVLKPIPFELYAMTAHGYFLGLMAFFFGYVFVLCGKPMLDNLLTWRWVFFLMALFMSIYRINQGQMAAYLVSIESNLWIFSILAFAYKHLNYPSQVLRYLSQSAYPVYIIHMIVLYAASYFIFPLNFDVRLKFLVVVVVTLAGSLGLYECLIRRWVFIRPFFGLKTNQSVS
ncbi:MAG: acyltransferase family protein [Marinicella pacifica]